MIPGGGLNQDKLKEMGDRQKQEGAVAAGSAIPAPTCRNSRESVNKLLDAVAADERGLSAVLLQARPHAYTLKCRRLPEEKEEQVIYGHIMSVCSHQNI